MQFFTLSDLSQMLLKGSDRVIENKEKINAINIFPVPDSDTGNNLANTLLGVQRTLTHTQFTSPENLIEAVLDAALSSSQGNSGIMLVSYLNGFLSSLQGNSQFFLTDVANALQNGAKSAKDSVAHPISGTMLDAMDAFALTFKTESKNTASSSNEIFYKALQETKNALIATQKKMKLLETYQVVDAGALGFTFFVYGMYEGISGIWVELSDIDMQPVHNKKLTVGKFPYEVVFTITASSFSAEQLKNMFHPLGDSLDIVAVQDKLKVHIHTDTPEVVKETALLTGDIRKLQVVDMRIATTSHTL